MKIKDKVIDKLIKDIYDGSMTICDPNALLFKIDIPFNEGKGYGRIRIEFRAIFILGNKIWIRT